MDKPSYLNARALDFRSKRVLGRRKSHCGGLLASAATVSLTLLMPHPAQAQLVTVPPGTGVCTSGSGGISAVCEGNFSAGLDADGPPLRNLTVQNLTADIGGVGIDFDVFDDTATIDDVTLTVNPNAAFGVTGIDVLVDAGVPLTTSNITIRSSADITASGIFASIDAGFGDITVSSSGSINSASHGIFATTTFGNIFITSTGPAISVNNLNGSANGIFGNLTGQGDLVIINSSSIFATADGTLGGLPIPVGRAAGISTPGFTGAFPKSVSIFNSGDITVQGNLNAFGIDAAVELGGTLSINSSGNIVTTGAIGTGIDAFALTSGTINLTSTGSITAINDGITSEISGTGQTTITTAGAINAGQNGINALTTGVGDITINATDRIVGGTTGLTTKVVSGSTSTVNLVDIQVQGGTVGGIEFTGASGSSETLNVFGNTTLSGTNGTAVVAATGNTTINNFGILNTVTRGGIQLGSGANAFNNRFGGTFNAGTIVNLGSGNTFTNDGVISPGGIGNIATTNVTGNFNQSATGAFLVDLDIAAAAADRIDVNGTASLAGNVSLQVTNPVPGSGQATILSATGGTTNNGLGLIQGPVFDANPVFNARILFPNPNDVVVAWNLDFTPPTANLNPNQTNLANYAERAFNAGSSGLNDALLTLINSPFDLASYSAALNQFLPEIYLNTETVTLFASQHFSDDLFLCPSVGEGAAVISAGQCIWLRPQGGVLNFSGTSDTIGFRDAADGLSAGAQFEFAPGWYGNLGLGYELGKLETDTNAKSTGHRFQGGVAIKYQDGPWLIGGAVSGGVASYDTDRPISVGAFNATAQSDHHVGFVTGQLRAAYEAEYDLFYARPSVDARLTYLDRQGLTETGGGAANLSVSGANDTYFSISPAIELGGTFTHGEKTTLRPFAKAGITYFTDSDSALTTQFAAAPAGIGSFSTTSSFGDLFFDIEAGVEILRANRTSLSLGYEGMISENVNEHGAYAEGTVRF